HSGGDGVLVCGAADRVASDGNRQGDFLQLLRGAARGAGISGVWNRLGADRRRAASTRQFDTGVDHRHADGDGSGSFAAVDPVDGGDVLLVLSDLYACVWARSDSGFRQSGLNADRSESDTVVDFPRRYRHAQTAISALRSAMEQ